MDGFGRSGMIWREFVVVLGLFRRRGGRSWMVDMAVVVTVGLAGS